MSTNFEYYKVFYYVAKYKNFTHAAQVLFLNQPSVTRYIHLLEQDLGCRLFVRSKHGVSLTPEGELLYEHVRPACESLFDGEQKLESVRELTDGTIYIGTTEMAFRGFLLDRMIDFRREFPKIKLKITCNSSLQAMADLVAGKSEFDVVTTPIESQNNISQRNVKALHDVLVCNPDAFSIQDRTYHLNELEQFPMIATAPSTISRIFYEDFYSRNGLTFKSDIEMSSVDLLIPLLQQGMGIGFIPKEMILPQLQSGELIQIPLAEKIPSRSICVIWDKRRPMSMAAHALFELLTKHAE